MTAWYRQLTGLLHVLVASKHWTNPAGSHGGFACHRPERGSGNEVKCHQAPASRRIVKGQAKTPVFNSRPGLREGFMKSACVQGNATIVIGNRRFPKAAFW